MSKHKKTENIDLSEDAQIVPVSEVVCYEVKKGDSKTAKKIGKPTKCVTIIVDGKLECIRLDDFKKRKNINHLEASASDPCSITDRDKKGNIVGYKTISAPKWFYNIHTGKLTPISETRVEINSGVYEALARMREETQIPEKLNEYKDAAMHHIFPLDEIIERFQPYVTNHANLLAFSVSDFTPSDLYKRAVAAAIGGDLKKATEKNGIYVTTPFDVIQWLMSHDYGIMVGLELLDSGSKKNKVLPKKRGPKSKYDPKKDKRAYDMWKSNKGMYRSYDSFIEENSAKLSSYISTGRELKKAIDRCKHRENRLE